MPPSLTETILQYTRKKRNYQNSYHRLLMIMMHAFEIQHIYINKVELYFVNVFLTKCDLNQHYKFNNTLFLICDTANSIVHT